MQVGENMWILLAICGLIPVVYLGHLLSKLDMFVAKGSVQIENSMTPTAIVLGETEQAKQITVLLEMNSILVFHLTEPFLFEPNQNFCYLFALSENDADNIVLCKIGKRVYSIEKMISLCNDRCNESMFIHEEIDYLSGEESTAQMIYQVLLPKANGKM